MRSVPVHAKVIAMAAAVLFATAPTLADEKTEKGVVLEFWKGHFDRKAGPFHEWDKEKEIPGICARCHGAHSLPSISRAGRSARRRMRRTALPAPTAMRICSPTSGTPSRR
jgi:hypothetical protein